MSFEKTCFSWLIACGDAFIELPPQKSNLILHVHRMVRIYYESKVNPLSTVRLSNAINVNEMAKINGNTHFCILQNISHP